MIFMGYLCCSSQYIAIADVDYCVFARYPPLPTSHLLMSYRTVPVSLKSLVAAQQNRDTWAKSRRNVTFTK